MNRPWPEIERRVKAEIENVSALLLVQHDMKEVPRLQARAAALQWVLDEAKQPAPPKVEDVPTDY